MRLLIIAIFQSNHVNEIVLYYPSSLRILNGSYTTTSVANLNCIYGILEHRSRPRIVKTIAKIIMALTSTPAADTAYLSGFYTLQWRHNYRDGISNHLRLDCLLNRLFRRISKKTSKLRVTGLGEGNSPVTGEFPAQRASKAENVSIWWRHH